jgi:hypothetical protein
VYPHSEFNAPWGKSLKVMTGLSATILVGIPVIGIFTGPHGSLLWILGMIVMPLSMLFIVSLFSIRGYMLTTDSLLIRRLIWNSRIALSGLQSIKVGADAISHFPRKKNKSMFKGYFLMRFQNSLAPET